jgi:hypothetical protein
VDPSLTPADLVLRWSPQILSSIISVFYLPANQVLGKAGFYSGMFAVIAVGGFITNSVALYCFGVAGANLVSAMRAASAAATVPEGTAATVTAQVQCCPSVSCSLLSCTALTSLGQVGDLPNALHAT